MKILNTEQVRQADTYTIEHEPVASIDLMERAATACYNWIKPRLHTGQKVYVFCGTGNNGGDGLVIARLLAKGGFEVGAGIVRFSTANSDDFHANLERLKVVDNIEIKDISTSQDIPSLDGYSLVVDAVFGSGLTRPVEGIAADVIHHINEFEEIVVSIDTPSGLFGEDNTGNKYDSIVKADYTLSFEFPKLSFFFSENEIYVGEWHVLPIGLHPEFIRSVEADNFYLRISEAKNLLHERGKFGHKGNFGHALLIAGSYGKMGAAVLAANACLKTGVGLLTVHTPGCGYNILQTAVPEAMVEVDREHDFFSRISSKVNGNAIGIGPGIGMNEVTQKALKFLIQDLPLPAVFDADAINILGKNKTWIPFLPKGCILTPHPKEFERITGKASSGFERYKLQREFSTTHGMYVVLKGAHTSISCPDGSVYFNSTGNPGMATAGSGDVLTGMVLSLLAQGYSSRDACLLGVFLHGLAGDLAATDIGMEALTATDIIRFTGKAYLKLWDARRENV